MSNYYRKCLLVAGIVFSIALLFAAHLSFAQFGCGDGFCNKRPASSPPASYVGPGDIVAGATAWFGFQSYTAAYATGSNPAADICDAATGLTCVTANIATSGLLDTSGLGAPCAVACVVLKLYDQTGGGFHAVQSNPAQAPVYTAASIGSNPCMNFTRSAVQFLTTATISSVNQPWTMSTVAKRTGSTTNYNGIMGNSKELYFDTTANNVLVFGGTTSLIAPATDNAYHAIQGIFNGASSIGNIDGSATLADAGSADIGTAALDIGATGGGGNSLDGSICEIGLWLVAFSAGDNTAMSANQHSRWVF